MEDLHVPSLPLVVHKLLTKILVIQVKKSWPVQAQTNTKADNNCNPLTTSV